MLLDLSVSAVVEQMEDSGHCLQVDSDLREPREEESVHTSSELQLGFHLSNALTPGSAWRIVPSYKLTPLSQ